MTFFQAIILAIIEGITEFLPISSTGHMILASRLMNIAPTEFNKSFEIFIQLGAIIAITMLLLPQILRDKKQIKSIALAFFPSAIIGLIFYRLIKQYLLGNSYITVITLILGGVVMIGIEQWYKRNKKTYPTDVSNTQAIGVGLAQTLSIVPGVSRSAATIMGGMLLGIEREQAMNFSFLLAIPTMIAATGLDVFKTRTLFTAQEYLLLIIGCIAAGITAWISVKLLFHFMKNHTFTIFGIYRIIVGLLFWVLILH